MTKKISIQATVTVPESVDADDVISALRTLGTVAVDYCSAVEYKSSNDLTRKVWVYVSADEDEPYVQVDEVFATQGKELSGYELQKLRSQGVCTKFYAKYPRADRYGEPIYAANEDAAAGVVAEHLFAVANLVFVVHAVDRGDDGVEEFWLCIAMPA